MIEVFNRNELGIETKILDMFDAYLIGGYFYRITDKETKCFLFGLNQTTQ